MSDSTGPGADSPAERSVRGGPPDRGEGSDPTRRRLLAASGGAAAALLAGCSGLLPERSEPEPSIDADSFGDEESDGNSTASPTPTDWPTPTRTSETDVVGLVTESEGSKRTFFVTLAPSPAGADWWQLETLDGERIVRESFDEPRTERRFTTDRTVDLDAPAFVVRGHDVEHGYGGQAVLADLENGGKPVAEQQGEEPNSFEDYEF